MPNVSDGILLLVIFEKAEVLQGNSDVLDIRLLVKAGREGQRAGELKIHDFNIIKAVNGSIVIEASGNLITDNETVVTVIDTESVFNATGGDLDNRRGIGFNKSSDNSIIASIRGDVIMNRAFNKAIIHLEYFGYVDFHKKDLNLTLDIKFVPSSGDFIGEYWGRGTTPLMGKYKLVNDGDAYLATALQYTSAITSSDPEVYSFKKYTVGDNVEFFVDFVSGIVRNVSFFNPPNADVFRKYNYQMAPGRHLIKVKIPSVDLTKVNEITVKFWTSDSSARDYVFTELNGTNESSIFNFPGINYTFDRDVVTPTTTSGIKILDASGKQLTIGDVGTTIAKELQITSPEIVSGQTYTLVINPNTVYYTSGEPYDLEIRVNFQTQF